MESFLPDLLKKITDCDNPKYLVEYLNVSLSLCKSLVVKCRFVVCKFTEDLRKYIHKVWFKNPAEDEKKMLFKLMDLTLYCHAPVLGPDRDQVLYVKDQKEWDFQLKNFKEIVDGELSSVGVSKYRMNAGFEIDPILKKLAVRLCYLVSFSQFFSSLSFSSHFKSFSLLSFLINLPQFLTFLSHPSHFQLYWNQSQKNGDTEGEPSTKRQRTSEKLQCILDFVSKSEDKINWSWFIILGEILHDHPETLSAEDYQPILKLLESNQNKMEFQTQMLAFIKCCSVMLEKEGEFVESYNGIVRNFCDGLWNNISENALR